MYETHKDVKLANEGLMRLASGGLCPLSTPWWRDSLLVGAKEGRGEREQEKKKRHELFPEYLFSRSLNNLGCVV